MRVGDLGVVEKEALIEARRRLCWPGGLLSRTILSGGSCSAVGIFGDYVPQHGSVAQTQPNANSVLIPKRHFP